MTDETEEFSEHGYMIERVVNGWIVQESIWTDAPAGGDDDDEGEHAVGVDGRQHFVGSKPTAKVRTVTVHVFTDHAEMVKFVATRTRPTARRCR